MVVVVLIAKHHILVATPVPPTPAIEFMEMAVLFAALEESLQVYTPSPQWLVCLSSYIGVRGALNVSASDVRGYFQPRGAVRCAGQTRVVCLVRP